MADSAPPAPPAAPEPPPAPAAAPAQATMAIPASHVTGRRAVAFIVDAVVFWIILFIIGVIWGASSSSVESGSASVNTNLGSGPTLVFSVVGMLYYILMEWRFGGTLGKMATGIHVVDAQGSRISLGQSAGRNLLRIADVLPVFIPYLLGWIVVISGEQRQRIGDRAAHTFVVRKSG